jgi:hypothetical protein
MNFNGRVSCQYNSSLRRHEYIKAEDLNNDSFGIPYKCIRCGFEIYQDHDGNYAVSGAYSRKTLNILCQLTCDEFIIRNIL